jgi:DNA modification methylase
MPRSSKPKFDIRSLAIEFATTSSLTPFENNPRAHDKGHVADIAKSVNAFGMVIPILCDDHNVVIAGHGTLLACQSEGLHEVPVIRVGHLSEPQKVALGIAHNRLCESGKWDMDRLASNFEILYDQDLGFDLTITGFDTGEIDVARLGGKESIKARAKAAAELAEVVELPGANITPISRLHDRFTIDHHVVVCGDARDPAAYGVALAGQRADAAIHDPPYNTKIKGNVSGGGKKKHDDFIMASGEMDRNAFRLFIERATALQLRHCKRGAYNCMFTGWYSMHDMLDAASRVFAVLSHICIWAKTNGSMGSPWRNSWEGILVHHNNDGERTDNIRLGKFGRNRLDVFNYAGVNTFRSGRMEELDAHPTCKPVPLLADLILDITPIGGLVLDSFLGSGATILGAHQAQRRGVGIELDPKFVDVALRRIEQATGKHAIHSSGLTLEELAKARRSEDKGER